jgi:hypothetical protein
MRPKIAQSIHGRVAKRTSMPQQQAPQTRDGALLAIFRGALKSTIIMGCIVAPVDLHQMCARQSAARAKIREEKSERL